MFDVTSIIAGFGASVNGPFMAFVSAAHKAVQVLVGVRTMPPEAVMTKALLKSWYKDVW